MAQDLFWFAVPLTMMFADVLSIATGVCGSWLPIYARAVLMAVNFCQFSNNPPNCASMDDAIIFLMFLHYTCNGTFWGGEEVIVMVC